MIITINAVPLSKNEYVNMHWSMRKKYKEFIVWLIFEKTYNITNHKKILFDKAIITFNIYFKTKRRRDIQNYIGGGIIAWLDALVDQKIIADDSYDHIGQPLLNFYIDKENPRTEIIIEEG